MARRAKSPFPALREKVGSAVTSVSSYAARRAGRGLISQFRGFGRLSKRERTPLPSLRDRASGTRNGAQMTPLKGRGVHKADYISREGKRMREVYDIGAELGFGSFGIITLVSHSSTGRQAVCKTIQQSLCRDHQILRGEINLLKTLDHPHIVRIFDYFEEKDAYHIVLEYCAGGDLETELGSLARMRRILPEAAAARYVKQVLMATCYCHHLGVIHRDLKPANIMKVSHNEMTDVKVIDFGLSSLVTPGACIRETAGTNFFMAPEVFSGYYDQRADIWSIGMTLYNLLSQDFPFPPGVETLDNDQFRQLIQNLNLTFPSKRGWSSYTRPARDLIRSMLQRDPARRITAAEALRSEWLAQQVPGCGPLDPQASAELFGGLENFAEAPLVVRVLMLLAAAQIDIKELYIIQREFDQIDFDHDGFITMEDLSVLLSSDGRWEKRAKGVLAMVDLDRSGVIGFTEFVAASLYGRIGGSRDVLSYAFSLFDTDQNGLVSHQDIRRGLDSPQMRLLEQQNGGSVAMELVRIFPSGRPMRLDDFTRCLEAHCVEAAQAAGVDGFAPALRFVNGGQGEILRQKIASSQADYACDDSDVKHDAVCCWGGLWPGQWCHSWRRWRRRGPVTS